MVPASPADIRGFVHRRGSFFRKLAKRAVGSIPFVGPLVTTLGEATGFFDTPGTIAARAAAEVAFTPSKSCNPGFGLAPNGVCIPLAAGVVDPRLNLPMPFVGPPSPFVPLPAAPSAGRPQRVAGPAVVGRFGAGTVPVSRPGVTLICPPGSILGKQEQDGGHLCYNRRDISNKERKWPRGRRPLLTGGEMRAISIASRAAGRLQAKQKQLQGLGLLKKPQARKKAAPKQLAPGHHAHVAHD